MPLYHLSLYEKLMLLVKLYIPDKPTVKTIELNEYTKDLFKQSDVYYISTMFGEAVAAHKIALDASGDKVYYFHNLQPDYAYRITRSINPPADPAVFIYHYINFVQHIRSQYVISQGKSPNSSGIR